MNTYKIIKDGEVVLRNGKDSIPFDQSNSDYQQYLAWLSEGNTPLPADQPSARDLLLQQIADLEATATPRRIREAIRGTGKVWLDNLDDQIAALRAQL